LKKTYANGDVILKILQPIDIKEFDAANTRNRKGLEYILKCFLESKSVQESIPNLEIPRTLDEAPKHIWYSRYEFEGAIISMILRGGAYKRLEYPEDYLREVARNFVDALFGDAVLNVFVCRIDGPWTNWFYDVAWDSTFIIFDPWVNKRWVVLCATDTD
jgi:hypothetical protein